MSVIYDALKKLNSSSRAEVPGRDVKPRVIGNIFTFPLLYLSPGGLLIIMLFVLLASVVFVFGVNYFKQFLPGETGLVRVVSRQSPGDKDRLSKQPGKKRPVDADLKSGKDSIDNKVLKKTTDNHELPRKLSRLDKADVLKKMQPRFLPRAVSPDNKQPSPVFRPVTNAGENALQNIRQNTMRNFRPASIRSASAEAVIDYDQMPPSQDIKIGIEKITPGKSGSLPDSADTESLKYLSQVPGYEQLYVKAKDVEASTEVKSEAEVASSGINKFPAEPVTVKKEPVQNGSTKKTYQISKLVAKLEKTMRTNKDKKVEGYLDELTRLKGSDDAYVLKMKAFWHMSRNEYNLATDILSEVLAENKNDIEAGINMAILEIKTDRIKEARKRLKRLNRLYPDNAMIQNLQKKILR